MATKINRKWNFSAGPATLPLEVLEQIQADLFDWRGQSASVMEISHRSEAFNDLVREAEQDVRDLLNVPDNYAVLFMSTGANAQFAAIPMNLLTSGQAVDYIDTGIWSRRAISEAARYAQVNVVASAQSNNYTHIPPRSTWKINPSAVYFHYTANETIDGLAFHDVPQVDVPLVCDMTSCLFAEPIDIRSFGLIYAGAQKNFGIAGLCLIIIRRDLIKPAMESTPSVFRYQLQLENQSLYSTPAVFAWYVASLMFKWMKKQGGLAVLSHLNQQKAAKLYQEIDASQGFYHNAIAPAARSIMNVPLALPSAALEQRFLNEAEAAGFTALKGHRLQGGVRISLYNAMPEEAIDELIEFMRVFQRSH